MVVARVWQLETAEEAIWLVVVLVDSNFLHHKLQMMQVLALDSRTFRDVVAMDMDVLVQEISTPTGANPKTTNKTNNKLPWETLA
jgi:hypothetical protein